MSRAIRDLALIAGLAGALSAAQPPANAQQQNPRVRLEQVREHIQAVQAQIKEKHHQHDALSGQLDTAQREIVGLRKRLGDLDTAIAAARPRMERLRAHGQQLAGQLGQQLQALARHARAAYRTGRQGVLQLLLAQDNPATVGRLLGYYSYYVQAQEQQITSLRADLTELTANRRAVAAHMQQLDAAREARNAALTEIKQVQKQRRGLLAKLDTRLHTQRGQLQALERDEAELEALIETLARDLGNLPSGGTAPPFATRKGKLIPPVDGPPIARFGAAKARGRLHWNGVWLAAATGTPVAAVAAGRVVYIGSMQRYGLVVVLDHGNDYFTVYGHNQSIVTELGAWVAAGEAIASAGTSGGHRTSGVYFEIRHRNKPLDPAEWLRS